MKGSDFREIEVMDTGEIVRKFPEKLVQYLETKMVFSPPRRSVHFDNEIGLQRIDEPLEVIACTDHGDGTIKYLCAVQNNTKTIVSSNDAVHKFPGLIVDFLESKIDINDCMPFPSEDLLKSGK